MNETSFVRFAIASSLLYVSCLVILIAGCGNENKVALKTDVYVPPKEHAFRQKVEGLLLSLDGKENLVRRSAYELCCEIRKEKDVADRLRLVALYTNAIQNISVDISPDHLDDEKGINDIDVRLRNSWHLVEWGTAALFDSEPDSLVGWTFLISAAGRYRDVLEMIEKKLSQRSLAARQRMRLDAFRRHISMMYESKVWGIGKTYWSLHDKIPPRKYEEIRKVVKRRLGVLPSEMANADVAPAPQGEVVSAELSRREQIEKILARNLRDVPVSRRYRAVTQKAYDMWKLFAGLSSNEMEYVILAVARFQRELEAELRGIEIPPKTVDLGPQHVSKDGRTRYYVATREVAMAAAKEERAIGEAKAYREQLQHFLSRYPNRLDSPTLKARYAKLSPEKKVKLMEKIIEVLGRSPRWDADNN